MARQTPPNFQPALADRSISQVQKRSPRSTRRRALSCGWPGAAIASDFRGAHAPSHVPALGIVAALCGWSRETPHLELSPWRSKSSSWKTATHGWNGCASLSSDRPTTTGAGSVTLTATRRPWARGGKRARQPVDAPLFEFPDSAARPSPPTVPQVDFGFRLGPRSAPSSIRPKERPRCAMHVC